MRFWACSVFLVKSRSSVGTVRRTSRRSYHHTVLAVLVTGFRRPEPTTHLRSAHIVIYFGQRRAVVNSNSFDGPFACKHKQYVRSPPLPLPKTAVVKQSQYSDCRRLPCGRLSMYPFKIYPQVLPLL